MSDQKEKNQKESNTQDETTKVETMQPDDLLDAMKKGKPYIAVDQRFFFQIKSVEIKSVFKICYTLIAASDDIILDGKIEEDLHFIFNEFPKKIRHWVRRGVDEDNKAFIDFEIVIQRLEKPVVSKDQLALDGPKDEVNKKDKKDSKKDGK